MTKFLLLLGPSGVGKSAIIDELLKFDKQFVYISPYMTRSLREGEKNKIMISNEQMDEMQQRGEFLAINELYGGVRYATPSSPIVRALALGKFPVLDWPIDKLEIMTQVFPSRLFVVYISPPSIGILRQRLAKDRRDTSGIRLENATQELARYWSSEYAGSYDLEVVSEDNKLSEAATTIYINYLKSFERRI